MVNSLRIFSSDILLNVRPDKRVNQSLVLLDMDDGQKWKNFLDFDEPSGPAHLVPSALSSPQCKPRAKTSHQVNRIPDWQVEDSGRQVKADPDSPLVKQRTAVIKRGRQVKADPDSPHVKQGAAAPRRGWLGGFLSYLTLKPVLVGLAGLLLMWCVLPVIRREAYEPLYNLFDLDSWDEIQRNMDPLHSMTQSKRFSNSEQIQATVKQA